MIADMKEYRKNWASEQRKKIGSRIRAADRWSGMLSRIKRKPYYSHVKILVAREDFIEWFMKNDFAGCSVDRIDSNGHYELSNIQLVTIQENSRKVHLTFTDTHGNCRVCNKVKPIDEFAKSAKTINKRVNRCKPCANRVKREWYARTKEYKTVEAVEKEFGR